MENKNPITGICYWVLSLKLGFVTNIFVVIYAKPNCSKVHDLL